MKSWQHYSAIKNNQNRAGWQNKPLAIQLFLAGQTKY